jgi:Alpha/beta hydrolase family
MKGVWIREPGPMHDLAVVFVHGILSNGQSCWLNENGTYWPALLGEQTEWMKVGVYVFTYRSDAFSGNYRLGDARSALKEHLGVDGVNQCRKLLFVCHSLGGILVRYFLVTEEAELVQQNKEIGLVLLGSPSLGSRYANWLKLLARALNSSHGRTLRFSQNNDWLNDLDTNFTNLKERHLFPLIGKELIEDNFVVLKRFCLTQIVEPFSGARYFGEPHKVAFSDHFSISKPADATTIQHRLLMEMIAKMLAPPGTQPYLFDPQQESQQALKAVSKTPEALARPFPPEHLDGLKGVNQALLETRRYLRLRQGGAERDGGTEDRLSSLWMDASWKIMKFDPKLGELCQVKGHGWADESVWSDPRYSDLPIKLNDILDRMLRPARKAAAVQGMADAVAAARLEASAQSRDSASSG